MRSTVAPSAPASATLSASRSASSAMRGRNRSTCPRANAPATSRRSRVCVGGSLSSSEWTWMSSKNGIGSDGRRGAHSRPSVRARSTALAAACVNVSHMCKPSCH